MTISNEQIQALQAAESDTLSLDANEISNQLRHLADNEIDSDSFAVVTENYNGREVEFERPITDLAIDAAEMMDKLLAEREADKALIAEQAKRIAELEARTLAVKLPKLKMLEDYLAEVAEEERRQIILGVKLEFHRLCKEATTAAGITLVVGE